MPEINIIKPQPFVLPVRRRFSKPQVALIFVIGFVFLFGLAASLQAVRVNHAAAAQLLARSEKPKAATTAGKAAASVPTVTKLSSQAFSQYTVAPDLPRYLVIPKLGVDARVLQTGLTQAGAMGTPDNVFDTAWYTGSAQPGQPGATLIDGHVSSLSTHGIFYNIKNLVAGDTLQITRGDGAIISYQVVRVQVYPSGNVDMQAAITPVTAGKSGLNLITCDDSNEQVAVFAQQT